MTTQKPSVERSVPPYPGPVRQFYRDVRSCKISTLVGIPPIGVFLFLAPSLLISGYFEGRFWSNFRALAFLPGLSAFLWILWSPVRRERAIMSGAFAGDNRYIEVEGTLTSVKKSGWTLNEFNSIANEEFFFVPMTLRFEYPVDGVWRRGVFKSYWWYSFDPTREIDVTTIPLGGPIGVRYDRYRPDYALPYDFRMLPREERPTLAPVNQ